MSAPRDFVLMVLPNEHVRRPKKLKLQASTIEELGTKVGEAVGLEEAGAVCPAAADASAAAPYGSLDEVSGKAKVMVWPASELAGQEQEMDAMLATAAAMSAQEEERAASPEGSPVERKFVLMIMPNEHVRTERAYIMLRTTASDLADLADKIVDAVGLSGEFVVCAPTEPPAPSGRFLSLDDVGTKAKVMAWPASALGDPAAAAQTAEAAAEAEAALQQAAEAQAAATEEAAWLAEQAALEQAQAEPPPPPPPPRDFVLMVLPNEHVRANKKLKLQASTIEELGALVAEAVGLEEAGVVCPAAADASAAAPYGSLDEVSGKAKVMVWPASGFAAGSELLDVEPEPEPEQEQEQDHAALEAEWEAEAAALEEAKAEEAAALAAQEEELMLASAAAMSARATEEERTRTFAAIEHEIEQSESKEVAAVMAAAEQAAWHAEAAALEEAKAAEAAAVAEEEATWLVEQAVSCHHIAAIWVAFFSRCQRYRC
eukprot:COSAG04_NODE_2452_length_4097_cov_5.809405_2_plen_488_part_00